MEYTEKQKTHTSKFISLILRHQPDAAGITLDAHGWADVPKLLNGMAAAGYPADPALLEEIVRTDAKQRYAFNEDHTKIRANQGHSVAVDLEFQPVEPPEYLWHGTASRFLGSIMQEGLKPMSRQYVHLSPDIETAVKVGTRHGRPVVLQIAAGQMAKDGCRFYRAENGVWLTDTVPAEYIRTEEKQSE